jgi:hypothetical protein
MQAKIYEAADTAPYLNTYKQYCDFTGEHDVYNLRSDNAVYS